MHSWIPSYSADVTDQASVSTIDDDYGLTRERVMNYRPAIPQSLEEASDNLLDKLEQAGRVPSKEKFRRMACNTFIFTGACPYNDRCVFLHDYRIKAEGVKVRTTRQSKSNSAIKDTFYWPDMSRREVVRHLDQQGLPTANQMYVIPDAFRSNPSNFHNRGLYSLWAHFVEFCVHNSVFYTKKYRDVTSEPFFQVSAYRENPHVPGAKRLDVFVKLSLGKSLCPASIALSPALSSFNRDSASNYRFSSKEPVMNALMEKQKRKTWSEANFKEHFPVYETPKFLNGNASGTAPYPSPVGFDNASFSPSGKPLLMKNRSKSAGSSAEAMFHPSWRSDYKPDFENEFDLECPTEDLYDAVDYNTAQQVELSLKSIDFDDDQGNTGNGDISALNTSNYDAPTFGWGLSTGSVDSPPYQSEFGPLNGATRMSANTAGFSTPASNWWDNTKLEEENNHSFQSRADTLWSPKFQPNQSLRYGNFGEHSKVSTIENFLAPKTDSPLMEKAPPVTKPQPSYTENQHYVIEPPASVAPRVSAPPVESNNFHYLVKGPGEKWDDYGANEWNSPEYEDSCATKYSNPYSSVTQRKKPKNPDYLSVKDHEFKDEGDWFSQLTCSHE